MIIKDNMKIKIIGDSLAAGVGSSNVEETNEVLFRDLLKKYCRVKTYNSWHNLLEKYLKNNNINCTITNYGTVGAFSYQINKYLDKLVSNEDDLVIVLVGINDRKRVNGLKELNTNLRSIIDKLKRMNKTIVVLTPTPSTTKNEYYENRIYHTPDIVKIIKEVCIEKEIELIDLYEYINNYLEDNKLALEDIIYGDNSRNDGFHPSDKVQKLMSEKIIQEINMI